MIVKGFLILSLSFDKQIDARVEKTFPLEWEDDKNKSWTNKEANNRKMGCYKIKKLMKT